MDRQEDVKVRAMAEDIHLREVHHRNKIPKDTILQVLNKV
jgi:hypothetical protein